ncbi:hypothetical protein [Paracoccus litorisediminis]|uniref:Ribbon-helix-helix protein, CopG family n=1 Tax=Paracoccus litorisediminis TaxID=2006130 RepID=A0A844HNV6_9RHOB|nr:hypothetical protein [Paracoccus litorisediminis]MTH60037.1 hypothetical protein [Paracoccus litorisediminis]
MPDELKAPRGADPQDQVAEAVAKATRDRAEAERARRIADEAREAAEKAEKAAIAAEVEARAARERAGKAPPPRPERRTDQISIRTRPSTRVKIESLAKAEGISLAELVERAIKAYAPSFDGEEDQ